MNDQEACRATFAAIDNIPKSNLPRAWLLDAGMPCGDCESVVVSSHSTGLVQPDEILIRILVAPQHVNHKGRPKAAALTDAERNGLSVLRQSQATDSEILKVATGLVNRARKSNPKARVQGVLLLKCSDIRRACDEIDCSSVYAVYDTALHDLPCHAEAFMRIVGIPDAIRDLRRKELFSLIESEFVSADVYRNGILFSI